MRRCHRQLVYAQVIASHGLRDPARHEVYILKQLRSPAVWHGNIVHQVLATRFLPALTTRQHIDWRPIFAAAHDLTRRQFAFSAARKYRDTSITKTARPDYLALSGHEIADGLPPEALEEAHSAVDRALSFLASRHDFISYLQQGSSHRVEHQIHFRLPALEVATTATVDLVFFRGPAKLTIVDWKIGNSETSDYTRQLHVYALAVLRSSAWPTVGVEDIHLIEANLLHGRIRRHQMSPAQLVEVEDFVFRSASELQALVGDVRADRVDVSVFDVARNPTNCAYCPFRGMCQNAAAAAATAALNAPPHQVSLFEEFEGELAS
jgi:hypothetical protein